mmetsp:Transcript_9240/g.25281  ORF Transcript_9240/g.25281 Transcript_9240/m.25281 type:complete len:185 (+) Transcript_9240:202-756(+)
MNVNYGGKQHIPDATKSKTDMLGPDNPKRKEGDMQYFDFRGAEETGTGEPDPPPFYAPHLSSDKDVRQAKGMKQVLWERGLWKDGIKGSISDSDENADQAVSTSHVLVQCEDFRYEMSWLECVAWKRGHIITFTPKGHCELAGVGVEYCWGRQRSTIGGAGTSLRARTLSRRSWSSLSRALCYR